MVTPPHAADQAAALTPQPAARLEFADHLRLLAIFGVVLLHISARVLVKSPAFGALWGWSLFWDAASRWSVPVFVMLSGMFLLPPREERYSDFFKRRFGKVLIPFLFWSGVYLSYRQWVLHEKLGFGGFVLGLVQGPAFYHLWFMYVILGLYLITPLLRRFLSALRPADLSYFLGLWALFSCLLPLSKYLFGFKVGLQMELATGYSGYFVLGYALSQRLNNPAKRIPTAALWALGLLGLALTLGGTCWLSWRKQGLLDQLLFSYFSPNVLMMAVAVFLLFAQTPASSGSRPALLSHPRVRDLLATPFGVYLCHPLVFSVLLNSSIGASLGMQQWLFKAWWGVPVASLLIFSLSAALVALMQRLPVLRNVVP